MTKSLFSSLFDTTYTLSDLRIRLEVIKSAALSHVYSQNAKPTLSPQDQTWLDKNIDVAAFSEENIAEAIKELETKTKEVQVLELFLPITLSSQDLEKVAKKIRSDFGPYLLEVKLDPTLLAGAAIAFKGIYKDYSLGKKIKDQEEKMKEMLMSLREP